MKLLEILRNSITMLVRRSVGKIIRLPWNSEFLFVASTKIRAVAKSTLQLTVIVDFLERHHNDGQPLAYQLEHITAKLSQNIEQCTTPSW